MFGSLRTLTLAAAVGIISTVGAEAATFKFGNGGDFAVDNSNGVDSLTSNAPVAGVSLTILGSLSPVPGAVGSSFDATANRRTVINQNVGAGVCGDNVLGTNGCLGQPLIDVGEMMIFQFSAAVTIESLIVSQNDQNDLTDFWFGSSLSDLKYVYTDNLIGPPDRTEVIDNSSGSFTDIQFFAVSMRPQIFQAVRNQRDQFRIDGINFTPKDPPPNDGTVPLPAAGWMLLSGVGGLIVMRRRRKQTS